MASNPVAVWLGQHFGWRSAFVLVGLIALLACALIHRALPRLPAPDGASPLRELGALANPQVWLPLGIGAIGFGGMFAVFSYVKPLLTELTGLSLGAVPLVGTVVALAPALAGLLVFGAALWRQRRREAGVPNCPNAGPA